MTAVEAENMTVVAIEDLAPELPELRVADRCDHGRCGAQAFVISVHPDGLGNLRPLWWCGHHARALDEYVGPFIVVDERSTLLTRT